MGSIQLVMCRWPYTAPRLVVIKKRKLDVHGGEDRENECLQHGDQDLEKRKHEPEGKRSHSEEGVPATCSEEEELGPCEEQDEQEVPDHHVHHETKGESDGTHQECRNELDRRDQHVKRWGNASGEERVAEKTARALLDTRVDEGTVGDNREQQGNPDNGGSRDVEPGDDSGEVHEQHHEENRGDQREEPLAVLLAQYADRNAVFRKTHSHLDEALATTWDDLEFASSQPKEEDERKHGNETDEDDPVYFKPGSLEEDDVGKELVDGGAVESALIGRGHYHQVHSVL